MEEIQILNPCVNEAFEALSLSEPPTMNAIKDTVNATSKGVEHGYCIVPSSKRFILLYSLLKRNLSKKVMVLFSTCNTVQFYSELLRYMKIDCHVMHGKQTQKIRTLSYFNFLKADKGILLCTDVATRGLGIPSADWIVQYDPPSEPTEYIYRLGQIAVMEDAKGKIMLFLTPDEMQFHTYLKAAKVRIKEYVFNQEKLANVQAHLEELVYSNRYFNKLAKNAYRSYILAYNSHYMKDIFNIHRLDLQDIAASFCFSSPPQINVSIDDNNSMLM